jgi:hypothetical protein
VADWNATSGVPWLTLSATHGKTPATVTINVNPHGLALGEYSSEVRIEMGLWNILYTSGPGCLRVAKRSLLCINALTIYTWLPIALSEI